MKQIKMPTLSKPQWLIWSQHLQALAQNGLTYAVNPFDIERYQAVKDISAEILSTYTQIDTDVIQDIFNSQAGYTTPKIDVRGVIFKDDRIMLVRELSDGKWTLPGGWADVNDSPSEAVAREVREETGYVVEVSKLLAVYDQNMHGHPPYIFHLYKLFFRCKMIRKVENSNNIETGECNFFAKDNIPSLSLPRTSPEEIERMFYHHENPDMITDFD